MKIDDSESYLVNYAPGLALVRIASAHMRPDDWRTIWLYWEDVSEAPRPAYLTLCLEAIQRHAGDARVVVVSPHNVNEYVPPETLPPRYCELIPAHRADYLRIRLLNDFGGMWIDIDTVVFRSLSEHVLDRLDQAELVSVSSRLAAHLFASRPGAGFVAESLEALTNVLAGQGALSWTSVGADVIYPIAERYPCAVVPLPAWKYGWREWHKYLEPGDLDDYDRRLSCALYNKMMFEPLRNIGRAELLGKDWLLANMLRQALGL